MKMNFITIRPVKLELGRRFADRLFRDLPGIGAARAAD